MWGTLLFISVFTHMQATSQWRESQQPGARPPQLGTQQQPLRAWSPQLQTQPRLPRARPPHPETQLRLPGAGPLQPGGQLRLPRAGPPQSCVRPLQPTAQSLQQLSVQSSLPGALPPEPQAHPTQTWAQIVKPKSDPPQARTQPPQLHVQPPIPGAQLPQSPTPSPRSQREGQAVASEESRGAEGRILLPGERENGGGGGDESDRGVLWMEVATKAYFWTAVLNRSAVTGRMWHGHLASCGELLPSV